MATLRNLGYLVLGVSDLHAWKHFATEIVGFQIGREDENHVALRMDNFEQRILLQKDDRDDIIAAGWLLTDPAELEAYVEQLRARDVEVTKGDSQLANQRRVESIYYCQDPNGVQQEFFCGPKMAPSTDPFSSNKIHSKFVTGDFGLGHFVPVGPDLELSKDFYINRMGLKLSGYISPSPEVTVVFTHVPNGRFHSLATAAMPSPKTLFHMAVEVESLDDVGYALDRAKAAGIEVTADMGHHPNAKSISFYMKTPSGFDIEILSGEIVIDDENWQAETYQQFSDWGHKPQT
ncbi:glyoxalase [Pseudomaricurvus alkylphenolicus]|uniref:VOC family protein n=1 Tax=Pseudomaricurvus alkylphenolicus TaxID=1306991 RepID=UPI00141DDDA7|nr:VOC family protein [Pseudomaricurvus alkylphenolicus]NIB40502.1 glyoxalase [Pseudomaricurvus alkylphenolicus]